MQGLQEDLSMDAETTGKCGKHLKQVLEGKDGEGQLVSLSGKGVDPLLEQNGRIQWLVNLKPI